MTIALTAYERPSGVKAHKGVTHAEARARGAAPIEFKSYVDGGTNYIFIYGEIGGWGVYAEDIIPFLEQLDGEGKEVEIRLQTDGGDVFEGQAIAVAIKRMKAKTVGVVYGCAGSMGSVILAACDEKKCFKNSFIHAHAPSAALFGNADQIRKGADVLDQIREMFSGLYASATNGKKTAKQILDEWLAYGVEYYMTPFQAVAEGMIDVIIDEDIEMTATASLEITPPDEIKALMKFKEPEMTDTKTVNTAKVEEKTPDATTSTVAAPADEAVVEPKALTKDQMTALVTAAISAKMPLEAASMISKGLTEQADIVAHLFEARANSEAPQNVDNKSLEAAPKVVASLAERRRETRNKQIAALSGKR